MPLPRVVDALEPDQGQLCGLPAAVARPLLERDRDRRPGAALEDLAVEGSADLLAVDLEVVGHVVEVRDHHQRAPLAFASSSSVTRLSSGPAWPRTRAVVSV